MADQSTTRRMVGKGVKFQRVRRVTGYLSADYRYSFNNAKKAECDSRVTHSLGRTGS